MSTVDAHMILSLFHLVMVVPLFLFVGYQRSDTPRWVYLSLLSIGLVVLLYHAVRLVQRFGRSTLVWVHVLHVLVVGPLLCYIGWHGRDTPRWAYEVILLLGFGAGGYHLFHLVKGLEAYPDVVARGPVPKSGGGLYGL
jgi:hypothetical protein